jgi:hypothetical protein
VDCIVSQTGLQNEVCQQSVTNLQPGGSMPQYAYIILMGQTGLQNEVCQQLITNVQPDESKWFAKRSLPTITST